MKALRKAQRTIAQDPCVSLEAKYNEINRLLKTSAQYYIYLAPEGSKQSQC